MSETKAYRAVAEREDGWWIITVPELDAVTQARRVDQIEHMARDLIAVWLEVDYDTVAVELDVQIPSGWQGELEAVEEARAAAAAAAEAASRQARRAASRLRAQGLTVRDVGYLLGVSPQRVSQLLDEAKKERSEGGTVVDLLEALRRSVERLQHENKAPDDAPGQISPPGRINRQASIRKSV